MSQRLYIGKTEEEFYDCIIDEDYEFDSGFKLETKLLEEWLCYNKEIYLKPFKIFIGDLELFKKIEFKIEIVLRTVGEKYPECIWVFYYKPNKIEHPSREELDQWIKELK